MIVLTDRNLTGISKDTPSCVISRISGREHNSVAVGILGDYCYDLINCESTEGTRVPIDNIFHDASLCYWYEYCQ
jgi:hypothetical protein